MYTTGQRPNSAIARTSFRPRAGDILSRFPETVRSDAPIREAAARMRAFGVGFLPVVDDQTLIGVVTDRDLVLRVLALPEGSCRTPVGLIMTRDVISCGSDAPISSVVRTMSVLKIRRIPVLDMAGERLLGVIGLGDLVRAGHGVTAALILGELTRPVPIVPWGIPDL